MKYWFDIIIKNQGRRLYIGVFWAFITALSGVALLMLSGWFITATAMTGIVISAGLVVMFDMYVPGSGIRFFALSRTVSGYVEKIYNHDSILRLISIFRLKLFKGLSSLPLKQLRSTTNSEWLSRLTADLDALDSILLRYVIPPITAVFVVLTLTLFLSFIWFELALYLGGFMFLCLVLSIRVTTSRSKEYAQLTASLLNETRIEVIEHLQGVFELKSYGLMQRHEEKLVERLDQFYQAQSALNLNLANIQFWLDLVLAIVLFSLICIALMAVNLNVIDGAIAMMLVLMFLGVAELLQAVPSQFGAWGKTIFSANRLTRLARTGQQQAGVIIKQIDTLDVSIINNRQVSISQNSTLSFRLSKHQILNIQGRSGSGKSSVANVLMGTETIDEHNKVVINKHVLLSDVSADHWFSHIAYLEQANTVLAGSLGYNLALGMESYNEEELWSVLKIVELFDWANSLPDGLNTWLGETGGKVSGGQARRICLARLLLRDPSLLILDEPFNGIDDQMSVRIWANMQFWIKRRIVVLLTHEQAHFLNVSDNFQALSLDDD